MRPIPRTQMFCFFALVTLCSLTRLLPHMPGFSSLVGAGLFAGYFIRNKWIAALVPISALCISDTVIGGYDLTIMAAVYLSALLAVGMGRCLCGKMRAGRLIFGSVACSVASFAMINFFVWTSSGLYPHSWMGIVSCYDAALPFLLRRILSDLFCTLVIFGAHLFCMRAFVAVLRRRWMGRRKEYSTFCESAVE